MKSNWTILLILALIDGKMAYSYSREDYNGTQATYTAQPVLPGTDATNLANYGNLEAGVMQQARNANGMVEALNEAQTKSNDRRQNADQAGNKGDTGAAASQAAGDMMIAAGKAMQAFLPTLAPGKVMEAMGWTEMAQSIAQMASKNQNHAGRDILKRADNDVGSQATGGNTIPKLPASAEQALKEKGVDPDEFARKAASGQFKNQQDVANAVGLGNLDKLDAEGEEMIKRKLGEIYGPEAPADLNVDETVKTSVLPEINPNAKVGTLGEGATGAPGSLGTTTGAVSANHGKAGGLDDSLKSALGSAVTSGGPEKPVLSTGKMEVVPPSVPLDGATWNGILTSLGLKQTDATAWEKKAMVEERLGSIGIELPRRGVNIFQKAKMRYAKFAEWRKATNVAAR